MAVAIGKLIVTAFLVYIFVQKIYFLFYFSKIIDYFV